MTPVVALTVAGSDSGGGAGIQADLKTFSAFGVFGTSAITAITAQNTIGVQQVTQLDSEVIREQIVSVTTDFDVRCVKTGMLGNSDVVDLIRSLGESSLFLKLVVDPVMVATTGARLITDDARGSYLRLLPLVDVITPNLHETEYLLQQKVQNLREMQDAARQLCDLGARSALVKGGHLEGDSATDVFYDGTAIEIFKQTRITTRNVHGTGCTLSAAICAALALGESTIDAIDLAKYYVSSCINGAVDWRLGSGSGPVNHLIHFENKPG